MCFTTWTARKKVSGGKTSPFWSRATWTRLPWHAPESTTAEGSAVVCGLSDCARAPDGFEHRGSQEPRSEFSSAVRPENPQSHFAFRVGDKDRAAASSGGAGIARGLEQGGGRAPQRIEASAGTCRQSSQ